MPNRVEEVRLRMERVLLGVMSFWLPNNSEFVTSVAGEGGREESVEAGVMSKVRRGTGRCSCGISMLKCAGGHEACVGYVVSCGILVCLTRTGVNGVSGSFCEALGSLMSRVLEEGGLQR